VGELQAVFTGAAVALALAVGVVVLWLRAGRPLTPSGSTGTAGDMAGDGPGKVARVMES
jgi:hypothetical protein